MKNKTDKTFSFLDEKQERKQKFFKKRNPVAKDLLTNGLYRAKRVESNNSKENKQKIRKHIEEELEFMEND